MLSTTSSERTPFLSSKLDAATDNNVCGCDRDLSLCVLVSAPYTMNQWSRRAPRGGSLAHHWSASQGLLILLQLSGGNPGLVIWGHALPIHQLLSSQSMPFVFTRCGS